MEIREAFDVLLEAAHTELKKVQQEGAAYFASGDTGQVRFAADRVENVQALIRAIQGLQEQWSETIPELWSEVPLPPAQDQQMLPGMRTPQENYRLPILKALVEMGGKGRASLVLDRVREMMKGTLNDIDREVLPSGSAYRWRNTAKWESWELVQEGYLSDQSPSGTWEITSKGRKYLDERG